MVNDYFQDLIPQCITYYSRSSSPTSHMNSTNTTFIYSHDKWLYFKNQDLDHNVNNFLISFHSFKLHFILLCSFQTNFNSFRSDASLHISTTQIYLHKVNKLSNITGKRDTRYAITRRKMIWTANHEGEVKFQMSSTPEGTEEFDALQRISKNTVDKLCKSIGKKQPITKFFKLLASHKLLIEQIAW